ncbi:MAG: hypothetical protein ACI8S6_003841 [Myxococcota bacterium]|jgi:hypothetical protein
MRTLSVLLGLASGCIAQESVVSTINDSDTYEDDEVVLIDDTGTDTGEADTEPSWDTSRWSGTLHFEGEIFGSDCDERVNEVGTVLSSDHPLYEQCPTCTDIYRLAPSADAACEQNSTILIPLAQPTLRGVLFGDGFAMIYAIDADGASLLDADGDYTDGVLTFGYTESFGGSLISVSGAVNIPAEE